MTLDQEIRGFVLEPKKGASADSIMIRLGVLIQPGRIFLHDMSSSETRGEDTITLKDKNGKTAVYDVSYTLPHTGVVAFVSHPEYHKLLDPSTQRPAIPDRLADYIQTISECDLRIQEVGAQG